MHVYAFSHFHFIWFCCCCFGLGFFAVVWLFLLLLFSFYFGYRPACPSPPSCFLLCQSGPRITRIPAFMLDMPSLVILQDRNACMCFLKIQQKQGPWRSSVLYSSMTLGRLPQKVKVTRRLCNARHC